MPAFDITDFLHPLDMAARQQLEAVPLLQPAVRKYLGAVHDRRFRQELLSSAVRLGPRQLSHLYRLLPPICDAFGIDEPELFVMRGEANAVTVGTERPMIVIYNGLLEDLAEDEVHAVLVHECGHILANHILYRQMAQALIRLGESAGALGSPLFKAVTSLAAGQLQTALFNWYRKGELTADRAAVAYLRDPEPMQRALFHIIGVPKWMPLDVDYNAFVEQAEEFDRITESNRWERYLARGLEMGSTHPIPTVRIRELTQWAESETFARLMGIAEASASDRACRCGVCGQQLEPDWRFCGRCGAVVKQEGAGEVG